MACPQQVLQQVTCTEALVSIKKGKGQCTFSNFRKHFNPYTCFPLKETDKIGDKGWCLMSNVPSTDQGRLTSELSHHDAGPLYNPPHHPGFHSSKHQLRETLWGRKWFHIKILKADLLLHWQLTRSPLKIKVMSVFLFKWSLIQLKPSRKLMSFHFLK